MTSFTISWTASSTGLNLLSKEEAVHFYNLLQDCSYIDHNDDYSVNLFKRVEKYCKSDWHCITCSKE